MIVVVHQMGLNLKNGTIKPIRNLITVVTVKLNN